MEIPPECLPRILLNATTDPTIGSPQSLWVVLVVGSR